MNGHNKTYTLTILAMSDEILHQAETLAKRLGHRETAYTTHTIPGLYLSGWGTSGVIVHVKGRGLMVVKDLEDLGETGVHVADLVAAEWIRHELNQG